MHSQLSIKTILGASVFAIACAMTGQAQAQPLERSVGPDGEIIVTGQRAQQAKGIEAKRQARAFMDVAASDEIGRLPDRNVAEVIDRLPGVGVQYDQGEGRYVAVRGVPSDLNGYTINGFELGNPDGDSRRLPLDIISGQLLNRIEVQKVKTADLIGQGIGGTINLVPQTAFDFERPFVLVANAQIGFQELRDEDQPVSGDLSIGGRFGSEEQFGLLLGASYSDRTFTSYGFYPDDWFPVAEVERGGSPTNIKYTDYRLKRERLGLAGSLDWRGGNTRLYLRGIYSRFTEDEYRQRFRLDFASADAIESGDMAFNADGLTGSSTDTEQRSDLRLEYKEKSILAAILGGETEWDRVKLEYGVVRSHNEVIEPNQLWQFRGNPGTADFDFTDKLYTVTPVGGPLAPSDLGFRSHSVQDQTGDENIWQGRLDITYDMDWAEGGFVKAGANLRAAEKTYDDESLTYSRGTSGNRFSLDGLAGTDITVHPSKGRGYLIAPIIGEDLILAFTEANLDTPLFVLDEQGTLADQVLSDYEINEDVYAGYVMADMDFGLLALTAGLRVERTEISAIGYRLENETDVVPAEASQSYTDWLPSVIARMEPSPNLLLRMAYSRSVGRPNYALLSPGGEVEYAPIGDGSFEGSVSLGNAALKSYRSNNLDASAEWYFSPGGLLAVGAFAKWIDNPIFTRSFTQTDVSFGGRDYQTLEFSQPENAENGRIYGLELAWQQQFTNLPGLLSGLGVNANLTLVDGKLHVPGRDASEFPEQSDLLWGVQVFYQKGSVEASVAYNHTGKALIGVAGDPSEDQFNDDLRKLDAKIAFDINQHIRIFAQGQNLTDEPTRQYQGGVRNWVIQHERYGRTFWVGATARW